MLLSGGVVPFPWTVLSLGATSRKKEAGLQITERDDSKVVTARAGQTLTLKLPCKFRAGYRWTVVQQDRELVELVGQPVFDERGEPQPLGTAERQVFRLRAVASGTAALEFCLRRQWEKDQKPSQVFRVTLEIR
jgi:predicted secreted protein